MDRKVLWVVEDRLQDPVSSEKRGCDGLVIGLNGGDWPFTHTWSNPIWYIMNQMKVNSIILMSASAVLSYSLHTFLMILNRSREDPFRYGSWPPEESKVGGRRQRVCELPSWDVRQIQ